MRYIFAALLLLAACAPAAVPVAARDGNTVTVAVTATQPFYLTSLILATTDGANLTPAQVPDPRCTMGQIEAVASYMACDLGTLAAGQTATVEVQTTHPVSCLAGGYTDTSALSYKVIPCRVQD